MKHFFHLTTAKTIKWTFVSVKRMLLLKLPPFFPLPCRWGKGRQFQNKHVFHRIESVLYCLSSSSSLILGTFFKSWTNCLVVFSKLDIKGCQWVNNQFELFLFYTYCINETRFNRLDLRLSEKSWSAGVILILSLF